MKRVLIAGLTTFLALTSVVSLASQVGKRHNKVNARKATNNGLHYFNDQWLNNANVPDWLKRTDINVNFQQDFKPQYTISTIQPLYMSSVHNTLFTQDRIAYRNDRTSYNIGGGYRYLTSNEQWMVGVNSFVDYRNHEDHSRLGVGGEMFHPYATLRANYYNRLSGWEKTNETSSQTIYERPMDGFDLKMEVPMPFLPWARYSLSYYQWQRDYGGDIEGYRSMLLMHPMGILDVAAGWQNDDTKSTQGILRLSWHGGRPRRVQYTALNEPFSKRILSPQKLGQDRLEYVRRHDDIAVEQKVEQHHQASQPMNKDKTIITIKRGT
jgi:hypothetical protein